MTQAASQWRSATSDDSTHIRDLGAQENSEDRETGSKPHPKHKGTYSMKPELGLGLEGRAIIVTGAAGGIGRAVVHLLDQVGATVLAVDLTTERAEEAIGDLDARHLAVGTDLRDIGTHRAIMDVARGSGRPLTGLAHMAAVLRRAAAVSDISEDDWDTQIDVNLKASFFFVRSVAEEMRELDVTGHIVVTSSQGWWTGGYGGSVVYNTAKGGLVTMVRGLARTYGPDGIAINSIAPGLIDTPMLTTDLDDEALDPLIAQTPLGRLGTPEEIASVVVFLLSSHASFMTGATVNVSGGFLMY